MKGWGKSLKGPRNCWEVCWYKIQWGTNCETWLAEHNTGNSWCFMDFELVEHSDNTTDLLKNTSWQHMSHDGKIPAHKHPCMTYYDMGAGIKVDTILNDNQWYLKQPILGLNVSALHEMASWHLARVAIQLRLTLSTPIKTSLCPIFSIYNLWVTIGSYMYTINIYIYIIESFNTHAHTHTHIYIYIL